MRIFSLATVFVVAAALLPAQQPNFEAAAEYSDENAGLSSTTSPASVLNCSVDRDESLDAARDTTTTYVCCVVPSCAVTLPSLDQVPKPKPRSGAVRSGR